MTTLYRQAQDAKKKRLLQQRRYDAALKKKRCSVKLDVKARTDFLRSWRVI